MQKRQKKALTTEISQAEVVTLAVYLLGGGHKAIDTEDIAVKANEIAPGRFIWRKYPDQINLELVRVYLSSAKNPEKGGWLEGSGKTGWTLTSEGLKWAQSSAGRILDQDLTRTRKDSKAGSIDERRWRRERDRVLKTSAWHLYSQGMIDIHPKEVAELFRIDSYAKGRLRTLKINRMQSLFEDDPEIGPFIKAMAKIIQPFENENK